MVKFAAALGLVCLFGMTLSMPSAGPVVSSSLLGAFKTQSRVDIAITLKAGISRAEAQVNHRAFATRAEKITTLRSALVQNADETQQALRSFLDTQSVDYESFWITNRIIVKAADVELVRQLANKLDLGVQEVREAVLINLEEVNTMPVHVPSQETVQWGVKLVKTEALWANNTRGEGIIVSNIDTGVRGTHRILKDNFLGAYGWYDPANKGANPTDGNGHGTHTMGTIAGAEGYGVAPASKWMACVGCPGGSCPESALLGCAQFVYCPTDTTGNNPDCTKAPHLVSNSWGSTLGGQTWYDDAIKMWHQAGIIPLFSAGNSGPFCKTVGSPGDRDVISVGATDINDGLAYFSSVGPGPAGFVQKPEISAPGADVLSAWNTGDAAFSSLSGTSMACPHIAGGVALLIQNDPSLKGNYQGIRDALFGGAETSGLSGMGQNCDGVSETTFPNYAFGFGRLDIAKSAQQ